jgi:hypothetical protein
VYIEASALSFLSSHHQPNSIIPDTAPHSLSSAGGQDVRVTSIDDCHGRAPEEFTAGGSKFNLNAIRLANPPKPTDGLFLWVLLSAATRAGVFERDILSKCTYIVAAEVVNGSFSQLYCFVSHK